MIIQINLILSGKTLGAGLSLGHLENGDLGARESSVLIGHHVSTDVNSWWNEQVFILEKCEWNEFLQYGCVKAVQNREWFVQCGRVFKLKMTKKEL